MNKVCVSGKDRVDAYIDGELHGEELSAFEAHLQTCTACAAAVADARALGALMRADAPPQPSPAFAAHLSEILKLESELEAKEAQGAQSDRATNRKRQLRMALGALVPLAACIVVFLIVMSQTGGNLMKGAGQADEAAPNSMADIADGGSAGMLGEPAPESDREYGENHQITTSLPLDADAVLYTDLSLEELARTVTNAVPGLPYEFEEGGVIFTVQQEYLQDFIDAITPCVDESLVLPGEGKQAGVLYVFVQRR